METKKDVQMGNLGIVIPRCNSQNSNPVGVHWLNNSFDYKDLEKIKAWVSNFWGDCDEDGVRIDGYDRRFTWGSGVSLCFDPDPERRQKIHRGRMTFIVPGGACDGLTAPDLLLLMEGCQELGGTCSRIDIFWDDYNRTVTPKDLWDVIDKRDYSIFQVASKNQTRNRTRKQNDGLICDEVSFGRRGNKGSGSYLRIYDKNLESNGECNCIRWELELSQAKAREVFTMLSGVCGDLECFAIICGALIGGCVNFVHRTQRIGDKNISRLLPYEWWERITELLGKMSVRVAKKQNTLTGMIEFQERNMSPSLACIRRAFKSEQHFYNWTKHILEVGDSRMNAKQRQIAKQNAGCLIYDRKYNKEKQESDYLNAMCVQIN